MNALGFIETRGFVAATEAADSALKAANVSLVGQKRVGNGLVTVIITGDVAAVKAAIDVGANSAGAVGEVITSHVIARPHEDMEALIGEKPVEQGDNTKNQRVTEAQKTSSERKKRSPGV